MRGLVVFAAFLLLSGIATAARGEPRRAITPGDQTRAKTMVVRASDVGPRFVARPTIRSLPGRYCAALDQSDLTLTGAATSPVLATSTEFVSSNASVYVSRADSSTAWSRTTSAAGVRCARAGLIGRVDSFERLALPAALGISVAYRVTVTTQGNRSHLVLVALLRGRAQAAFVYDSVVGEPTTASVVRVASRIAKRMKEAMRGSS